MVEETQFSSDRIDRKVVPLGETLGFTQQGKQVSTRSLLVEINIKVVVEVRRSGHCSKGKLTKRFDDGNSTESDEF